MVVANRIGERRADEATHIDAATAAGAPLRTGDRAHLPERGTMERSIPVERSDT